MKYPLVSIIIPALNEEKYIAKCLQSVKSLDYPKNKYEVILVDNGSKDKTVKIAKQFNINVIKKPKLTIAALRNTGAKYAKGDILAFVDADCVVNKNWLKLAILDFKKNKNLTAVGYYSLLPSNSFWLEKFWEMVVPIFDKKIIYLPGRNFLIKSKIFKKLNGFDENLISGEDPELCYRLYKYGYFLKYNPYLKVVHLDYSKNLFQFIQRRFWYTSNYFYLFKKYGLKTKMGVKFVILLLATLFICTILVGFIIYNFQR